MFYVADYIIYHHYFLEQIKCRHGPSVSIGRTWQLGSVVPSWSIRVVHLAGFFLLVKFWKCQHVSRCVNSQFLSIHIILHCTLLRTDSCYEVTGTLNDPYGPHYVLQRSFGWIDTSIRHASSDWFEALLMDGISCIWLGSDLHHYHFAILAVNRSLLHVWMTSAIVYL